jgi:hypothetical protein
MTAKPTRPSRSQATSDSTSGSAISPTIFCASYFQPRPVSIKSRDIAATAGASCARASRMLIAAALMPAILPALARTAWGYIPGVCNRIKGNAP